MDRLLKRTEEQRALKLDCLRTAIRDGDVSITRGDVTAFNSEQELDAFFANS